MAPNLDFDALAAANRRDTWILMFAFFGLLAIVSVTVSTVLQAGLIGVIFALIFSASSSFMGYVSSDKIAISSTGAKPAPIETYGQLHNIVEGISLAAGVPKPRVFVVEDAAPNAFATGKNPENAAVAVTTGLLALMSRDELEGVIAHELAHIRNLDIRVMTVAVATAGTIAIVVDVFWRLLYYGGGGGRGRDRDDNNPLAIVGLVMVAILAPIAAAMLKAAVSRRREALADASAVAFTRHPSGLRKALEKLDADNHVVRRTSHATSHLWIETPDDHQRGRGRKFNDMFDTHPPLATRINTLRAMEGLPPYQPQPRR